MTDIATLVGRLLPFAVIASLAMIFYLLDVFSVRPAFEVEQAKVAARQISVAAPRRVDTPSRQPSATFPAATAKPAPPANQGVPPAAESTGSFDTANEMPPSEPPTNLPQPAAPVGNQDNIESGVPRYVPPAGSPGQPLATDTNNMAPVQLPNDEIPQDEGESVDSETLQALDQAEQAASQAGAIDQEQQQ
jgi:hypothetical protein